MERSNPLVSVVAVVQGDPDRVEATLRSVLEQSFADLELIVQLDAASEAVSVVERLASDARVRLLRRTAPAERWGESLLRCLARAEGAYLAPVEAGDRWSRDKLAHQVALLEARPDVDLSFGAAAVEGDSTPRAAGIDPAALASRRCAPHLLAEDPIPASSALLRRGLLRVVGPPDCDGPAAVAQHQLWIKAAVARARFHADSAVWTRLDPDRESAEERARRVESAWSMRLAMLARQRLEDLYPEIGACRDTLAARACALLDLGVHLASGPAPLLLQAAASFREALRLDPLLAAAQHNLARLESPEPYAAAELERPGQDAELVRRRAEADTGRLAYPPKVRRVARLDAGWPGERLEGLLARHADEGLLLVTSEEQAVRELARVCEARPAGGPPVDVQLVPSADLAAVLDVHRLEAEDPTEAERGLEGALRTVEPAPAISVVIPVFNRAELTEQCLRALEGLGRSPDYELLVVDNASSDRTPALLESSSLHPLRLCNAENLGFAAACNQGARLARGELLVFLNNDTIPLDGWLQALVSAAAEPDVGIVGARLLYPDDTVQHAGVVISRATRTPYHAYRGAPRDAPHVSRQRELAAVTGACMLVRRDLFCGLDGFDEGFRNGFEDIDLCLRARRAGARILYEPTSTLYHLESQSDGRFAADPANVRRFLERWGAPWLADEDAFFAEDGFATRLELVGPRSVMYFLPLEGLAERPAWERVAALQERARGGRPEAVRPLLDEAAGARAWPSDPMVLAWGAQLCEWAGAPRLGEALRGAARRGLGMPLSPGDERAA